MNTFTDQIKKKAIEIGFSKVGIVAATPLHEEGERLNAWIASGYGGQMSWMARDPGGRSDPRAVFPEVRSVIALALNYYTPHGHDEDASAGKISRYAWGDDYHDVMRQKLVELLDWIKSGIPGSDGRVCIDTAPVMDKAWAVRAGLGWLGKHSNVITKEFGSWVFLGEILLNIELEYHDFREDDHCGSCTACIDACPTDAIVQPHVVDSNLCLSYATIELRAPDLPAQISSKMSGWLYGCDICQEVCPWNRFEKPSNDERFEPRNGETALEHDAVLGLSQEQFSARFRRSAMKRTKLTGLQRNARHLKTAADPGRD